MHNKNYKSEKILVTSIIRYLPNYLKTRIGGPASLGNCFFLKRSFGPFHKISHWIFFSFGSTNSCLMRIGIILSFIYFLNGWKGKKVHRYYYPFGLETTSCIGRIVDIKSFSINFFFYFRRSRIWRSCSLHPSSIWG